MSLTLELRNLAGLFHEITAEPTTTIRELKHSISKNPDIHLNISPEKLLLYYCGRDLVDELMLSNYNIKILPPLLKGPLDKQEEVNFMNSRRNHHVIYLFNSDIINSIRPDISQYKDN